MDIKETTPSADDMLRPPVNRAMRALDRSFFQKRVPLTAARVLDNTKISNCKKDLEKSKDLLQLERMPTVRPDPEERSRLNGPKCLLLRPDIKRNDASTWSTKLQELVRNKDLSLLDYDLELKYDYWTYHDIISSIIPEDEQDELPSGFTTVGHIAHLNLRDEYLPYKRLIAEVILDKTQHVRTVINKIDFVGTTSEYRTFKYEHLMGDPDMNVELKEQGCIFRFDYSKVYWNSRLETEHRRLIDKFKEGEAVCDVMAGVGPFAIPSGKRKVFVWANDLNPDSYASLKENIQRNKVSDFVRPFNEDGRTFIHSAAQQLIATDTIVSILPKPSRSSPQTTDPLPAPSTSPPLHQPAKIFRQPWVFSHYVMNLPASALTFLDAFIGLYRGHENLFFPYTVIRLPMIHVYCFSTKSVENVEEERKICKEISQMIGFEIKAHHPEVEIWDVRKVAPKKMMFCASFRLPREVAFR